MLPLPITTIIPLYMDTVTVKEAAEHLNLSEQAVRKRLRVGTLDYYKDEHNRIHIYLPTNTYTSNDYQATYIQSLEEQVQYLKEQLDHEKEASSELRRVIALQAQRLPEIRQLEGSESSQNDTGVHYPSEETGEAHRGTQTPHRSLLARIKDAVKGQ